MSLHDSERPKTRSFLSTMAAIGWSFIGLRRKKDFDHDVGNLNPVYVIIGGLIGAVAFVAALLTIAASVA